VRIVVAGLLVALVLVASLPGPRHASAQAAAPPAPSTSPSAGAPAESSPWVRLAEALMPAVVNVRTSSDARRGAAPSAPDPLRRRPQDPREGRGERRGLGSGFIIDPTGYIVTNHHVVDGAASIEVTLADGRTLAGKLVGSDAETDLAVLKVEATGLPTIPLGRSSTLKVAEPVMAIGNPFGLDHTVTVGIISGTGRVIGAGRYDDFLQTDAAINPGNSGGPLIDTRGEAVGIATAIVPGPGGGSRGIGFAIPIDLARPIVAQLRETGKVTRGWLGVTIQSLTPELAKSFGLGQTQGALVAAVSDDSPAARAGFKPGDVIVRFDGKPVEGPRTLPPLVAGTPVGKSVAVEFLRDGATQSTQVVVGNLADMREARADSSGSESRVAERFGLALQVLTPELAQRLGVQADRGVVVTEVRPNSPAAQAGLAPGDVIREVNRLPVQGLDDVERGMRRGGADPKQILLRIEREGSQRYVVLGAG
jgi:serine protease Do